MEVVVCRALGRVVQATRKMRGKIKGHLWKMLSECKKIRTNLYEHWDGRYSKVRISAASRRRVGGPIGKLRIRSSAGFAGQIFISNISSEDRVLKHLSRSLSLKLVRNEGAVLTKGTKGSATKLSE